MIRRRFIRALSGAILTTLLGVKAWRLEASEPSEWDYLSMTFHREPERNPLVRWHIYGPGVDRHGEGDLPDRFTDLQPGSVYTFRQYVRSEP